MLTLLFLSFSFSLLLTADGIPLRKIQPGQLNRVRGRHGSSHLNTVELRKLHGKPLATVNMPPEEKGVEGAFESDIKLTEEQIRDLKGEKGLVRRRRKVVDSRKLWPNGVIVYEYGTSLAESVKQTLKDAIQHWQSLTCLQFIENGPGVSAKVGHSSRVIFSHGAGCLSRIGRIQSAQETQLNPSCAFFGSVVHEIGHVAGFYHEHSRTDRDTFVKIIYGNIKSGMRGDFDKIKEVRSIEPYDLGSVMHYGPKWFSKNKQNTIEPWDLDFIGVIGQRGGLSFMDAKTANVLYKCNSHCRSAVKCANGGYTGPKCQCMCPEGLTGDCTRVKKSSHNCGAELSGPSGHFSTPNFPQPYGNNMNCYWLITAPSESTFRLSFSDFELEDDENCSYDYVGIHAYGPELAGAKYCDRGPSGTIEYNGTSLLVKLHSDDDYTFKGFRAQYTVHRL